MRILIFGATGMVGRGVMLECLDAADVDAVTIVARSTTGLVHPKLTEILSPDLFDLAAVESALAPFDACFFCLGVSSFRMQEQAYQRLTYDLTKSIAERLAPRNPQMTFVYVSGARTDASERGRSMWARVKGRTENALQRMPFRAVYLFRPGVLVAVRGVTTKTAAYRWVYAPLLPILLAIHRVRPATLLTTADLGQAMLAVARRGGDGLRAVVEVPALKALARSA